MGRAKKPVLPEGWTQHPDNKLYAYKGDVVVLITELEAKPPPAPAPPTVPAAASVASSAPVVLTEEQYTALDCWNELKAAVEKFKPQIEAERTARQAAIRQLWGENPSEGTHTIPLDAGWNVKAQIKYARELDQAQFSAIFTQPCMEGVYDRVIRWTPELNVEEYRKLTDEQRAVLDQCITTKPTMPALYLNPPKEQT